MDDVAPPDWIGVVDRGPMLPDLEYIPFVLSVGDVRMQTATALKVHADGHLTVDWRRLELFARLTPVDLAHSEDRDFQLGCMVRALLAMRDGRVTVVEDGDG